MEMSYTLLGMNFHITLDKDLTIRHSPLITFVLFLNHDASLKIQWLAQILLWSAPITISAGCRLILSIREAVSSQCSTAVSRRTMSAFAVQDESWKEEDSRIV